MLDDIYIVFDFGNLIGNSFGEIRLSTLNQDQTTILTTNINHLASLGIMEGLHATEFKVHNLNFLTL